MRGVLRRLVQLVVVLLCVSFFSFALLNMFPGDPVVAIVGFSSQAQREEIRHQLRLDEPFVEQYWNWAKDFAHGDLGNVYYGPTGRGSVATQVGQSLPISLQLMAYSMILTLLLAIPLGVFDAYRAA